MSLRHVVQNDSVRIVFDPEGGHMERVTFDVDGREIEPLHRAPWNGGGALGEDVPVVLKKLAGDFFCAPFCQSDVEPAPWHGWTSNGLWRFVGVEQRGDGGTTTRFRLDPRVMGAAVTKEITLRPGHTFVYQRHIFEGGSGSLPVAHHAMVRTDMPVTLSFSQKAFGTTPDSPVETDPALGHAALAYPQRFTDLRSLKGADGTAIDGTHHPIDPQAEDLVLLVDAPGSDFAWSAALSPEGGFLFLGLKDPRILPATLLWMSNFGRTYAPWSARHGHCLGIEELCSNGGLGHAASVAPNVLSSAGVPTAITLDPEGSTTVSYAFGAIPVDRGWRRIVSIVATDAQILIEDESGRSAAIPFDRSSLAVGQ